MGLKWKGMLKVEFEMEEGRPEGLAEMVLEREVAAFQRTIEKGAHIGGTGVKHDTVKVTIESQGPAI